MVFYRLKDIFFSDYSYLALQEEYISNVDLVPLEKADIGLLSVKGDKIEKVIPAIK